MYILILSPLPPTSPSRQAPQPLPNRLHSFLPSGRRLGEKEGKREFEGKKKNGSHALDYPPFYFQNKIMNFCEKLSQEEIKAELEKMKKEQELKAQMELNKPRQRVSTYNLGKTFAAMMKAPEKKKSMLPRPMKPLKMAEYQVGYVRMCLSVCPLCVCVCACVCILSVRVCVTGILDGLFKLDRFFR